MYILDIENKSVKEINKVKFSELNLTERYDLQEWIDNTPEILGEELLIIQKEFNGFDKTKERLDLLAIDKKGNLVLIENKLDSSGVDVTWQALKYVSYCSELTTNQIINIYDEYLKKKNIDKVKNAEDEINNFLITEGADDIALNIGYSQRIILVAREFKPEVTSTVLWLRANGIDIQCIKIIPYKYENNVFIDIDKIIPVPETENYMIKLSEKETEERKLNDKKSIYADYWAKLLDFCNKQNFQLFENRNTSKDPWLSTGAGISFISYKFILQKSELKVALYISSSSKEKNDYVYNALLKDRAEIQYKFENGLKNTKSLDLEKNLELQWDNLDNRKSSRIYCSVPFDRDNRNEWIKAIEWHYEHMKNLEIALKESVNKLNHRTILNDE